MKKILIGFCFQLVFSSFLIFAAPENSPLYFGNPSVFSSSAKSDEDFLLEKRGYTLSYNSVTMIPNWVMWHLSAGDEGELSRSDDFREDKELPVRFYRVKKSDYQFSKYGFDRGHLCPSADRTFSPELNSETFLMTNMIPQAPDVNRIVWKQLESHARKLVESGKELYIAAGPYGRGGVSAKGNFTSIELSDPDLKITVPEACWKIILVLDEGENDFQRVNIETEVIAVYMPNIQGLQKDGSWERFVTSVDFIEETTGLDFFSELPDEIEDFIEAKVYGR